MDGPDLLLVFDSSLLWKYLSVKGEVKVTQSCPTLCDPIDYTIYRILQARVLEQVTYPLPRESSQPRDRTLHCRQILYQLSPGVLQNLTQRNITVPPTTCPTCLVCPSKYFSRNFPGGPVVKNPPANAGNTGSIPGQRTKIPHTLGQLA